MLLVLVLLVGWMGFRVFQVYTSLQHTKTALATLEQQVRDANLTNSAALLHKAQTESHRARAASSDPIWGLAAHLPILGSDLHVTTEIAQAADGVTHDVLPGTIRGGELLRSLKDQHGGVLDLQPFGAAARPLSLSYGAVTVIGPRLHRTDTAQVDGPVAKARTELESRIDRLTSTLAGASAAAETVPRLLGGQGPKHYFLALQNNAESRGSGGLVAAFGIVEARAGRLTLTKTGVNDELTDPPTAPLQLGHDFDQRYGSSETARDWLNANESPDFPTTGRILTSLWNATEHSTVDGVIALDPVAVSYILQATGPVTLSDGVVSAANVVDLTMRGIYQRFPTDNDTAGRTAYLKELLRQAISRISTGTGNRGTLAERLGRAVLEGHLQVYSAEPDMERILRTTRIAGALPKDQPHFLELVTQNLGGDKLDYYLRREIHYSTIATGRDVDLGNGRGPQPEQRGDLTVVLRNTAPPQGLPPYVTTRADLAPGVVAPEGQNRLWVSVYLGSGAQLERATLGGRPVRMQSDREQGLGVYSTVVDINPGASVTLHLTVFDQQRPGERLVYRSQPLAVPDTVSLPPDSD